MKRNCRSIVALLLCVTLIFTVLSVTALAEGEQTGEITTDVTTDTTDVPKDDFGVVLTSDKSKAKPGDIITISLEFTGNPGMNSYIGSISCDEAVAEYVDGSAKLDEKVDSAIKEVTFNGAVKLKIQATDGFDKTGVMMTAQFKIKDGSSENAEFVLDTLSALDSEDSSVSVDSAKVSVPILPAAESIALDKTELSMQKGSTEQLTATVAPDSIDTDVIWSSSDESVATVDNSGKVTAVKPGAATITAKADNKTADCTITVTSKMAGISMEESILLSKGQTHKLTVTYAPADTTDDKTLTWSSSNESIAKVDENGVVTAIADGNAVITVKCGDFVETCDVTVRYIEISQIALNHSKLEIKINETETLTATVTPENATDYGSPIKWSSSDESVATVDENGKITAVSGGTATITAQVGNKTSECRVTVIEKKAISLIVEQSKLEMEIGEKITLDVTVNPKDTTDELTFSSSDTKVATVSKSGRVTAVGSGTAEITVKVGSHTKVCTVIVAKIETDIEKVEISQNIAVLNPGDSLVLGYTTVPGGAEAEKVVWTSSDDAVVTVDENGKITAIAVGNAQIVVSVDGITAICSVTVEDTQTTPAETTSPVTEPDTTESETSPYPFETTHEPAPGNTQSMVFKIILVVIIILILAFIGITVVYFINRRNMYGDYDDDDDYEYDDED